MVSCFVILFAIVLLCLKLLPITFSTSMILSMLLYAIFGLDIIKCLAIIFSIFNIISIIMFIIMILLGYEFQFDF